MIRVRANLTTGPVFYVENNEIVCQCCLKIKTASIEEEFRPIDANVEVGKETKKIYELFNTFGDDFGVFRECQEGSLVCSDCLQQLVNTTNFYQKCMQSQALIKIKQDLDQVRDYVPVSDDDEPSLIRIPTPPVVYEAYEEQVVLENRDSGNSVVFPEDEDMEGVFQILEPLVEVIGKEEQPLHFWCLKCEVESSLFETQSDILIHLSEAHEAVCILCETCGAVFDSTVNSDSHRLKHFIESNTRYDCTVCSAQFPSAQALQHHSVVFHSEEIHCQLCLKPCDELESLNSHLHQHVDQRILPCIYCPLQFRAASLLNEHIKNEHIKENHDIRWFVCVKDNCLERFHSKDLLRKHQQEKHEETRVTYNCKVCKSVFDSKNALTEHLETHLNGNKFIPVHTTVNRNYNNNNNYQGNTKYYKNKPGNYRQQNNNQRNHNQKNNYNNNNQQGRDKPVKRLSNKGNVHARLG